MSTFPTWAIDPSLTRHRIIKTDEKSKVRFSDFFWRVWHFGSHWDYSLFVVRWLYWMCGSSLVIMLPRKFFSTFMEYWRIFFKVGFAHLHFSLIRILGIHLQQQRNSHNFSRNILQVEVTDPFTFCAIFRIINRLSFAITTVILPIFFLKRFCIFCRSM